MSAHRGVGTGLGQAQGQIGTDAVDDRLVSLTTGVLWSWRWGPPKRGNVAPDRSLGDASPSGPHERALGLRRRLCGLRLVRTLLEAAVLVSDPALVAGATYSLEMVEVKRFHEGEFWYWTDKAEKARASPRCKCE